LEEFFTQDEDLDLTRFRGVGVIGKPPAFDAAGLDDFGVRINELRSWGDGPRPI